MQAVPFKDQVAQYSVELLRLKEMTDVAFASGAKASNAPEDLVIFPLLVSCRDVMEEILFAINEGFGRSALRSVRTMYECVAIARHLSLHPEKTKSFLDMMWVQWAKIIQNIPIAQRSAEMHTELSMKVPKYAKGQMMGIKDLDWSGENTLRMAKEAGQLAELHSVAFDYASAYIHPSAVLLLSAMSQAPGTAEIQLSVTSPDEEGKLALLAAHDLLLNAVDLRLKYSFSDSLKTLFEQCKKDFINIWGYTPHI